MLVAKADIPDCSSGTSAARSAPPASWSSMTLVPCWAVAPSIVASGVNMASSSTFALALRDAEGCPSIGK